MNVSDLIVTGNTSIDADWDRQSVAYYVDDDPKRRMDFYLIKGGERIPAVLVDRARFERLRAASHQLQFLVQRFLGSDSQSAAELLQPGDLDPLP